MTFASPHLLWALVALPAAALAYVWAQSRRSRYAVRFTNLDLLANVVAASPRWRRHLPPALTLLALSALIVALAKPQVEMRVAREEASVILTMDNSRSMRATDVAPSRLDAARSAARRFIEQLPEEVRVGLVSFDSSVDVLSPPVSDHASVLGGLDLLDADGGTAMGDGLSRALDLAASIMGEEEDGATPEDGRVVVIVLLSDGANTTGVVHPVIAAREAERIGVPVYTIALGTDEGTVEIPDRGGGGRVLPVPPDRETLRFIADTSGGLAFDAPSEADLDAIYENLGSRVGFTTEEREVTAAAAGIAAALLVLGAILSLAWFGRFP